MAGIRPQKNQETTMGRRRIFSIETISIACGLIASLLIIPAGAAQQPFTDWTDAEKEAFLLNAEIVDQIPIGIGITGTVRCTLDDGSVQHDAQIQTVYERIAIKRFENGTSELNFTDLYTYNIAAYRLDRLIGLNMTPVAVPRHVGRQDAALVWWEDDILMMEGDRYKEEIQPPRPIEWVAQVGNQNIFQQLIYNTDQNMGNMLITNDWKLWIVDFTRAFRTNRD